MARETNPLKLLVINDALRTHPGLKYLFKSALKDSFHNDFGCVEVATDFSDATGYVFEPNSPKPARASKRTADPEIEGAYCAYTKTSTLRGNRFSIIQPTVTVKMPTTLTFVHYIAINGLKYGWRTPKPSSEQLAEVGSYKSLLDIQDVGANDKDIVYGSTFPKPPKVQKTLSDGSKFSSFCSPLKVDDALGAGWALIDPGLYTVQDLNNLLR